MPSVLTGIFLKLSSVAFFVVMAALIKATADDVPTGQAMFFRSFFALPVILGWLALRGEFKTGLRTQRPMGHFWRGLIGSGGMIFGFASLGYLPLPEVTAIGFAGPLMTVILAAVFLGERLRAFRLTAVFVGLAGVIVIMSPRLTIFGGAMDSVAQLGVALVLASAFFRALAQIHIRKLSQTEHTAAIVFYFSTITTLMGLATFPFGWTALDWTTATMLIGSGLVGGVAQIMITSAFRLAPASVIAPLDYVSILFAMVLGYVVFAEIPTAQMLVGSVIVIASGLLIIWRERQLGLARGKARPNLTPQG